MNMLIEGLCRLAGRSVSQSVSRPLAMKDYKNSTKYVKRKLLLKAKLLKF